MSFVLKSSGSLHNHEENIQLVNIKELYDFKMTVPERIDAEVPLLKFTSNGNFVIPDYYLYGVLHLGSEGFIQVLSDYAIEHQVFPVEWSHNNKAVKMSVVHFIGEIDFIDREQSNAIVERHGYIEEIERLVLIKERLKNVHLAIPESYLGNLVVVSNELKNAMKAQNITGTRFISIGNYRP